MFKALEKENPQLVVGSYGMHEEWVIKKEGTIKPLFLSPIVCIKKRIIMYCH
jgi:hypothetical protein